ncbi:MAG TPA: exodeoxyribonuclease V subunit gamma [Casimicrobiaceae bacterium]
MLRIVLSNRYEVLEAALLARLDGVPASPFVADQIIVPSAAIRRKVELAIADRTGICANVEFPFLAQWLWKEIGALVAVAETSPFAPEVLAWRIYAILGDAAFVAAHAPLARYLAQADERMRYDLAARAATLIEHYITYRPAWLDTWSRGHDVGFADGAAKAHEEWQAALWRRIAEALDVTRRHPSLEFFNAIAAGKTPPATHATRVHVFCVPSMPPLYLDIVRGLARFRDVDLYALNPCREYWFDIVDAKRLSWLTAHGRAAHHESGNRLLAAWGEPTKAYLSLLFDDKGEAVVDESHFEPAPATTLLAATQNAILDLSDLAPGSVVLADGDRSLELHVCHSRTRELEVLHDRLLALFAADGTLKPADVLVVTPDLAKTAPLIDAVFGNALPPRHIPYAITGRPRSEENPVAGALLAALTLAPSRFAASDVFDLLQRPIVARRFGLDADALASVHRWIQVSGIRWGLDVNTRAALDLPEDGRFTFDDGLDRLFAGYAWPAQTATPFDGRLPAGDPEGSEALALGAFARFVSGLTRLRAVAARRQTPAQWFDSLHDVLADLVLPAPDDAEATREVHVALATLRDDMLRGGVGEPLRLSVVQAALAATIDAPTRGGVPTGAVTFASMASLRALPYRVVCAIGLDDGAFPARTPSNEFDLLQAAPARGDRQRRLDDRNILLDLLLAARDFFHVSYVGRSVRDNAPLPPAAPVSELVDYVAPAIAGAAAEARSRLTVAHPLQPFSVTAFDAKAPHVQSFDAEYAEALRARSRGANARIVRTTRDDDADEADDGDALDLPRIVEAQAPFFDRPLPPAGPEWQTVPVEQLLRFYRNPSRLLLERRLGIALPEAPVEIDDDEPFGPDGRTHWRIADRLLAHLRAGASVDALRAAARAGIEYPPGPLGDVLIDREVAQLDAFARAVAADSAAPLLPPIAIALDVDVGGTPWRVEGALAELRQNGLVRERYVNTHANDYLEGWIRHLILNAARPPGVDPRTVWHSRNGTFSLSPLAADVAHARLGSLVAMYAAGLAAPLRFFPKSSWAYVRSDGKAYKARGAWNGAPQFGGESADPAFALAFRGVEDPLDRLFEDTAHAVFAGLIDHLDDPRVQGA